MDLADPESDAADPVAEDDGFADSEPEAADSCPLAVGEVMHDLNLHNEALVPVFMAKMN